MIESVYDADGNKIGFVEYRCLTIEEVNRTYKKEVKEAERCFRKEFEERKRFCRKEKELIMDINGKYFHHSFGMISNVRKYRQSRRKRGHPKRDVNYLSKGERREQRKKDKKRIAKSSEEERKRIEETKEFCKVWDAPYKDYKNIWTNLYNKDGEVVGRMEEGLDAWWHFDLQLKKGEYFRLQHCRRKKRAKIDLRKYQGFENEKVITYITSVRSRRSRRRRGRKR